MNSRFIVHVTDAPDLDMDLIGLSRHHRVFAGEGVFPLRAMIDLLGEKEYNGWYAVEIFNDEYWTHGPREMAERAMASMRKLLG